MESERSICEKVIKLLEGFDKSKFGIENRSQDYTSLIFCDNDFMRVKFTDKARWISIRLAKEDRNENDERFKAQTKKGQLHWKANIVQEDDIYKFEDVLINACKSLGGTEYKKREENHSTITLSLKDILKKIKG